VWVYTFRVDEKLRVKLADSGLSRDLFPDDYSCLNDNENRPIKWMALESITLRTYNGASDMVSSSTVQYIVHRYLVIL
jgi:RYK receptor-like tyrosine kinase